MSYQIGDTLPLDASPFDHKLEGGLEWVELDENWVCGRSSGRQYIAEPWAVVRKEDCKWSLHYITGSESRCRDRAELCARCHPNVSFFVMAPSAEFLFGAMQIKEFDDG